MRKIVQRPRLRPRPGAGRTCSTPPDLLAGGESAVCPVSKNPIPAFGPHSSPFRASDSKTFLNTCYFSTTRTLLMRFGYVRKKFRKITNSATYINGHFGMGTPPSKPTWLGRTVEQKSPVFSRAKSRNPIGGDYVSAPQTS